MNSPKASTDARSREQGRVLIVTDNSASFPYAQALEDAGLAIVGTSRSMAVLIAQRRARPHVIIADAKLQGLSAQELAQQLRRAEESATSFILAGEDASGTERRLEALKAGASDYFQLPRELPLLVERTLQLVQVRQTVDRLRSEADRDYLTGLSNRRRFRNALGQEVERWRRYKVPCALLIADVDHLKRINDTHGHSAGDVAIRHVAQALAGMTRDNDTAARLGGEEFALLLAGADTERALAAAERLRQQVCSEALEGIGQITISLGVASCPAHARSERELYAASDMALYTAKREGRNRVSVATEIIPALSL